MKKKRKIQIPAAAYGIGTNYETQLFGTDYAGLLQLQGNAYTRMNNFRLGMANKDLNAATNFTQSLNKDMPIGSEPTVKPTNTNQQLDIDYMGAAQGAMNLTTNLIDQFGTKSTATTGKEAVMQSISDIGNNAAAGALIGTSIMPGIGTAIGAGAGAITGLIGRSGLKASMTSFTDYNEGTLGTGLIGAFGNKGLRRERARIKQNAYNNRAAVQGTNYLQNEAYDDLLGMNASASAYGGVPTSVFFGDAGEWMRTEDGEFHKIPEDHSKTDSKLIQADGKVQVLSDALKVGGKTPAKWFDEMATTKKSKFNDIYALNAAKLNKMNNNMIFDLLFALQESIKQLKGIKPKTKQLIPAAETGLETGSKTNTKTSVNPWGYGDTFKYYQNGKYDPDYLDFVKNGLTQDMIDNAIKNNPKLFSRFLKANPNYRPTVKQSLTWATDGKVSDFHNAMGWIYENRDKLSGTQAPQVETVYDESDLNFRPDLQPVMGYTPKIKKPAVDDGSSTGRGNRFNWGSLASKAAALAPIMSNLFTSNPEVVDAIYNPYATSITNTMRRRRYDASSAIEDLNRNRAISNYNASQFNTSTGANLAYRLQSAVNTDRAIANLRTMENNYNNQYLGDYANIMNNLGQQWVNATNIANEANAQNRATARNIRRAGLSQLSQWAQNNELMRNNRERDNAMLALYGPFLEAGNTAATIKQFNKWLRKGGNYAS